MKGLLGFLLLFVIPIAVACVCPPDTDYWWENSQNVLVVRVDSVHVETASAVSGQKCASSSPHCVPMQTARYTTIEKIKGPGISAASLVSGYGGGDCGIPLIAGAYYVVFLEKAERSIGFCNTAGPYLTRGYEQRPYPKRIEDLITSLRQKAKDPKATIATPPEPSRIY